MLHSDPTCLLSASERSKKIYIYNLWSGLTLLVKLTLSVSGLVCRPQTSSSSSLQLLLFPGGTTSCPSSLASGPSGSHGSQALSLWRSRTVCTEKIRSPSRLCHSACWECATACHCCWTKSRGAARRTRSVFVWFPVQTCHEGTAWTHVESTFKSQFILIIIVVFVYLIFVFVSQFIDWLLNITEGPEHNLSASTISTAKGERHKQSTC